MKLKDLNYSQIMLDLENNTIEQVRSKYSLECPNQWGKVAKKLFSIHINSCSPLEGTQLKIADLNKRLINYALILPSYVTRPQFYEISKLLNDGKIPEIKGMITSFVMDPYIRAWHHNDKFLKLDIFEQFHEYIHSSLICYYHKNYKASYITLLPIVEGLFLRWQEKIHGKSKSDFDKLKKFIKKSVNREPRPFDPHFTEIYIESVSSIINEHLFLDTKKSTSISYDNFNRHQALHMLEKQEYGTKYNVSRLFLLLDFISIIYTNEGRISDETYLFRPYNNKVENIDLERWENLYKEAKKYQYTYS